MRSAASAPGFPAPRPAETPFPHRCRANARVPSVALGARDSSLLAWQNPPQMEREYDDYFAALDRSDENAWPAAVEEATQRMLDARGENRVPEPEPQPTNPLEAIIDWFKRLLGL